MGRKKKNFEQMPARFPEGTLGLIDSYLEEGETRADFLRSAVETELRRRDRIQRRIAKKQDDLEPESG